MTPSKFLTRILAALLLAVLILPAPAGAAWPPAPAAQFGGEKVLVDLADTSGLAWLQSSGAVLLAEYDTFSLWQLLERGQNDLQTAASFDWQPVDDAIYLREQVLRPALSAAPALAGNAPEPELALHEGEGFWMVQFVGPLQDAWIESLLEAGLQPAAYLPNNAYVVWGPRAGQQAAQLAAQMPFIQWTGPYLPAYRLSPALVELPAVDTDGAPVTAAVTAQVYPHPAAGVTIAALTARSAGVIQPEVTIAGWTTISLLLPVADLAEIAAWPDVFNLEPWQSPELLDETQGQIMAGNITRAGGKTAAAGPGYLEWLNSKGFPTDPARYPLLDIVDDGIDSGNAAAILHPDFYQYGIAPGFDRVIYLTNCTNDASANGLNGHGNLNAGIAGGYNQRSGFPFEDPQGFNYGLGISPYGRLAGTKVFSNGGLFELGRCGGYYTGVAAASASSGAAITSNSWGNSSPQTLGQYTAAAQVYDSLTRDASITMPGLQPMLHVFSAGNAGHIGARSITPPATAKNVLTVGASENTRDNLLEDGCSHYDADSADDIAAFSSRGPLADGRMKPDLVAPGLHVQGPASQTQGFTGASVCGSRIPDSPYYPNGQTLYTWSSGTSHAAPAVAGAAQLAYEYYGRVLKPGAAPSPAMVKALLINGARYLDGAGSGGSLPGPSQGWGSVDLSQSFTSAPRFTLDQTHVFEASGGEISILGGVIDSRLPLRVTLVWTDAPGATSGAAYVNNLDLEVTAGGQTYKGNVFQGGYSAPGGTFDPANNVENVFLPPGVQGAFQVRVIARNIAGDGLPGNSDPTDQDFALVITNGQTGLAPKLSVLPPRWNDSGGQIPKVVEPGESVSLYLDLANTGNLLASGITSTLMVTGGQAQLTNASAAYPNIAAGASASSTEPFRLTVGGAQTCGQTIELTQIVRYEPGRQVILASSLPTGFAWSSTYHAGSVPAAIPDWPGLAATANLNMPLASTLLDVNAQISIQHARAGDLSIRLLPPGSPAVTLASAGGGSGANYQQTIFDDQASVTIAQGSPPYTGSYRPQQPLAALNGKPAQGSWQVQVTDQVLGTTGQLTQFSLTLRFATCDTAFHQGLKRIYMPVTLR